MLPARRERRLIETGECNWQIVLRFGKQSTWFKYKRGTRGWRLEARGGDLFGAKLCDAGDELGGDGLIEGELEGALVDFAGGERVSEGFEETLCGGVEGVVVLPGGAVEEALAVEFPGGHVVGNGFFGSGDGFADGGADAVEGLAGGWGLGVDVVVDGLEGGFHG
jgi:hypothetical protein